MTTYFPVIGIAVLVLALVLFWNYESNDVVRLSSGESKSKKSIRRKY